MPAPDSRPWGKQLDVSSIVGAIRRGYSQFLAVPTLVVAGFVALSLLTYILDRAGTTGNSALVWLGAIRSYLRQHIFSTPTATASLLSTVATGVITVTSITFSILLLAVQQSAAPMSSQIYNQYVHRRENQFYFGFFVGLALYALLILSTVNSPFNPVIGGTVALALGFIGLLVLIILLYSTINQMRPSVIVAAITANTLQARAAYLRLLLRTRRISRFRGTIQHHVCLGASGFVIGFNMRRLEAALKQAQEEVEVVLRVESGAFVDINEVVAEVHACNTDDAALLAHAIGEMITLGVVRTISNDANLGVDELGTIGWTTISTSKDTPNTGLLAIHALGDILAHLAHEAPESESATERSGANGSPGEACLPVVIDDGLLDHAMQVLSGLCVPASASMQYQSLAAILHVFAAQFPALSPEQQRRAESIILMMLSTLGAHVLTRPLDTALGELIETLKQYGKVDTAQAVQRARDELQRSIGKLNDRSSREKSGMSSS